MLENLLPFLTAAILLTISPGPDIIYVLVQSMANGKKAGIITTTGLVSGIIIHTTLVAFGVSAIIRESEYLFFAIKVLGAFYLFYLAIKVAVSNAQISINGNLPQPKKKWSLFRQGFIMNVLNPKVTLFFLAFFPGFLWDTKSDLVLQFYILGFFFILQAFIIFSIVALLAGKISNGLKMHPRSELTIKWIQVLVFVGLGIFILI